METQALTIEQAKELKPGTILNHNMGKNANGTPARYKVTSVKVWKRTPGKIEVRVQRGLREHYRWDEFTFNHFVVTIQGGTTNR